MGLLQIEQFLLRTHHHDQRRQLGQLAFPPLDSTSKSVTFPTLPQAEVKDKLENLVSRGFMIKKIVFDNGTKAKMAMGGQTYNFQ